MKVIISPAKSLDFTSNSPFDKVSQAQFLNKSQHLINYLSNYSPKDISVLMKISDKLGELNYQRFQNWKLPFDIINSKQAIYSFTGDVYKGLDATTIPEDKIEVMQDKLRILSGLYGLLRPFDLIQPYRLEMGTKLSIDNCKNLYDYWGNTLVDSLNQELDGSQYLVDLASKEYSKSIPKANLKAKLITPIFKESKGDGYKVVGIHAKRARGLMTRYIILNNVTSIEKLLCFDANGYAYSEHLSDDNQLVFIR